MTGTIDNILSEHLQNAPQDADLDENKPQIIAHILDIDIHSKKGQFLCLSSNSNYHLLQYPDGCGRMVDPQGNVGYNCRTVKVTDTEPYYIRAVPATKAFIQAFFVRDTTVYIG